MVIKIMDNQMKRITKFRTRCFLGFALFLFITKLSYAIYDSNTEIEKLKLELEKRETGSKILMLEIQEITKQMDLIKKNNILAGEKITSNSIAIQEMQIYNTNNDIRILNLTRSIAFHKLFSPILSDTWKISMGGTESLFFTTDYKVAHSYKKEKVYKNEWDSLTDYYDIVDTISHDKRITLKIKSSSNDILDLVISYPTFSNLDVAISGSYLTGLLNINFIAKEWYRSSSFTR